MRIAIGVLYTLLPELVLLVIAAALAPYVATFPSSGLLAAELAALFILIVALVLSLLFNRSRMFFALLSVLIAYGALLRLAHVQEALEWQLLSGSLSLLLPLDILAFHWGAERGVFSRYGALRFGVLLLEIMLVLLLVHLHARAVAGALQVHFVRWSVLAETSITQPGLLVLAISLLTLNDKLIRRHSAELAAFFFALVTAAVMLHTQHPGTIAVFTAAIGLAFGFAIIQESWSMAYLDELTGLPGRRALEEQLRQLGGSLGGQHVIAMLDVDHFKRFNDTYGHDVGDQVLKLVASRLQMLTGNGKAYRYGGEEFCLVYAGKSLKEVVEGLEGLRMDIETSGFDLRHGERRREQTRYPDAENTGPLQITASIGAAESRSRMSDPWSVLKSADRALYNAKQSGRNCVRIAGG